MSKVIEGYGNGDNIVEQIIVSRPQFNTGLLKPGTVVKVFRKLWVPGGSKGYHERRSNESRNCLVLSCTPLELVVGFYWECENEVGKDVIDIKSVLDGLATIDVLAQ